MMTMRGRVVAALLLPALGAGACRKEAPAPAAAGPAVATFDGGTITAEEIDEAILSLPPQSRQPADGDLLAWYEKVARDIAVTEILTVEAKSAGLDRGPAREAARREAVIQAAVAAFVESLPAVAFPKDDAIKAYYDAHRAEFESPRARETLHIFKRAGSGASPEAAMAAAQRLRARALAGEDFGALAREASDSESRHANGLLGWVVPGHFNADLDRILFSLKPGVPSQPLSTAEGVHLFLVRAEQPARTLTLTEARMPIARRLIAQARADEVLKRVGTTLPEGSIVPDAMQLQLLYEAGDPSAVALKLGEVEYTLGDIQNRLMAGQAPPDSSDSPAHALVVALRQRYLIHQYTVRQGTDRGPEVDRRVDRLMDRELAGLRMRERLLARLDRDPERVRRYYEANRKRFSTPLQLRVQRLSVPMGPTPNRVMARLEAARAGLDRGREDLAALATELSGTVEEPAWRAPSTLALRERRTISQATGLQPGRHSAPYSVGDRIEVIRVVERKEPTLLPFEQAQPMVRAEMMATRGAEEYAALVKELLAEHHYQVSQARLEALLRRPSPAGS